MRAIRLSEIRDRIKDIVQEANPSQQEDVARALEIMEAQEESAAGKEVFREIRENTAIAREEKLGLCQDTGLAIFFVELGSVEL
jgi:fumarate hydratase subunit alpha